MELQQAPAAALMPSHPWTSTSVGSLVTHRNRLRQSNKSFERTALTIVSFFAPYRGRSTPRYVFDRDIDGS